MTFPSKSRPWSECKRWGISKLMKIFSHRSLATVVAFWYRVGKAHGNLVKLSGTTRMFSNPPFPLSKERKSMASSSIGSFARNDFMGALGRSGTLRPIHLPQWATYCLAWVAMNGQKNRERTRYKVRSLPGWPTSSWRPLSAWLRNSIKSLRTYGLTWDAHAPPRISACVAVDQFGRVFLDNLNKVYKVRKIRFPYNFLSFFLLVYQSTNMDVSCY